MLYIAILLVYCGLCGICLFFFDCSKNTLSDTQMKIKFF